MRTRDSAVGYGDPEFVKRCPVGLTGDRKMML
jgi:hypothetical protein